MRKNLLFLSVIALSTFSISVFSQQLPDPGFEDWSGTKFNDDIQLKYWHASNVEQVGFKFTFVSRETGRTGYAAMVQDKSVGAMGITEEAPGYLSLGTPWQYLPSVTQINNATAGTSGGISFTYRPDTIAVWIKRTGSNWANEDFHVLFYSWKGTAKSSKYTGKNGSCTSHSETNEESDIRLSTDGNVCGTDTKATQIAEGWLRDRKQYTDWTLVKVPIFYLNSESPSMCNVIFSAGNYPNFRANSGLYAGNSLYIDDVELIYSSKIDALEIGGKIWAGFNPDSYDEQTYSLPESATSVPEIKAKRGIGSLTNAKGTTASFPGRYLDGSELSISAGGIDEVTTLTVNAGDGSSSRTYKIRFVKAASTNAVPNGLTYTVNDETKAVPGFSQTNSGPFDIELPYGTNSTPTVAADLAPGQTVQLTQASSTSGSATIAVTAADGKTKKTYTINFSVKLLDDNKLQDILIDGESLEGFSPTKKSFKYSMPEEIAPTVTPVSSYAEGEQTIKVIPNGVKNCTIQVSVPGNATTREYIITYVIEKSSYKYLSDLSVTGYALVPSFKTTTRNYTCNLPIGTTTRPVVKYSKGDKYQTVVEKNGGTDGATTLTVTAGDGTTFVYTINFSVVQSSYALLGELRVNDELVEDFNPSVADCSFELPIGTTTFPSITWLPGDEYQTVKLLNQTLEGVNTIQVTAGDGTVNTYRLTLSVKKANSTKLKMIYVGGEALEGFSADKEDYSYVLPAGTTVLPEIKWDEDDEYQTITSRSRGVNGDYVITVKAQTGESRNYTITFSVATSVNTNLSAIKVNGVAIDGFSADKTEYSYQLSAGSTTIPRVTAEKGDATQTLTYTQGNPATILVTAQSGATKTYTVNFITSELSQNNKLKDLRVGGVSIEGFNEDVYTYSYVLPQGTTVLPSVSYVKGEESQTVTERSGGLNGNYVLTVVAESGARQTYTITFSVITSDNVELKSLSVGGEPVEGFSASITDYYVVLPESATSIPAVTYEKSEDVQTVTVRDRTSRGVGDYMVIVRSESALTRTYTIHFSVQTVEHSSYTRLSGIMIDGELIDGFDKDIFEYWVVLPIGTVVMPAISWTAGDAEQTITLTDAVVQGKNTIRVQAGNGAVQNYTINISVERASNVNLKMISIAGESIDDFSSSREEYTYYVSSEDWPEVSYEREDTTQTVSVRVRKNGIEGQYQLVVMSESGDSRVYSINFVQRLSSVTTLNNILLDGEALFGFSAQERSYTVDLAEGRSTLPVITVIKQESTQRVNITQDNPATIEVIAEDGTSESYTIRFNMSLSSNSKLRMIMVGGMSLADFAEDNFSYSYELAEGEVPELSVEKGDEWQQVTINVPSGEGVATITVSAQTGASSTYTVDFSRPKVGVSEYLKDLQVTVNDVIMDWFDANQTEFFDVEYNGDVYEVEATGNEWQQISVLEQGEGVVLIVVTVNISLYERLSGGVNSVRRKKAPAANSTDEYVTYTYTLHMVSTDKVLSSNTELASLSLSEGVLNPSFTSSVRNYSVSLSAGSALPTISYVQAEKLQHVTAGLTKKNEYTITVVAEDGTTDYYVIDFDLPDTECGVAPSLSELYVGGVNILQTGENDYVLPEEQRGDIYYSLASGNENTVVIVYEPNSSEQHILLQRHGCDETVEYKIAYTETVHTGSLLSEIRVGGYTVTLVDGQTDYVIPMTATDKYVPAINVKRGDEGETVVITYSDLSGTTTIDVTSEDGNSTTRYNLTFERQKSSVEWLMDIAISGVDDYDMSPAFDSNVTDYTVLLKDEGTAITPVIEYEKMDDGQVVEVIYSPLGEYSIVRVTAEDELRQKEYKLRFINVSERLNELESVTIDGVGEVMLGGQRDVSVNLPLGTTELAITDIKKNYAEQTVMISNGGVLKPTVIVVRSGNSNVPDVVYTITPHLETLDRTATLSAITIDGEPLAGFRPEQFTYIVDIENLPSEVVGVASGDGAEVNNEKTNNSKKRVIEVTESGVTNTYTLHYYYKNDTIPNWNFNGEAKTTVYGRGVKPIGWNAPDDFVEEGYSPPAIFGLVTDTYYTGHEVGVGNGYVILNTIYAKSSIGGSFPGMVTLGTMDITLSSANGTTSSISGPGIRFRNTPQSVTTRYNPVSSTNVKNIHFLFTFTSNQGNEKSFKHTDSNYDDKWHVQTISFDGNYSYPNYLNIVLNAAESENAGDLAGTYTKEAKSTLYVDYIKLNYNSKIKKVTIDGEDAALSGTNISYTISDAEYRKTPDIRFEGEVDDQMHVIEWLGGGIDSALVHSYAEDGSETLYRLDISRPRSSVATLNKLLVDGVNILDGSYAYVYDVENWNGVLPTIEAVAGSVHQTIEMSYSGNTVTYTVRAENGDVETYSVLFRDSEHANLGLSDVSVLGQGTVKFVREGENEYYSVTQRTAQRPSITAQANSLTQTVRVTAEQIEVSNADGESKTYPVVYDYETTGLLVTLDGVDNFNSEKLDYIVSELPSSLTFLREHYIDKLRETISDEKIQIEVESYYDSRKNNLYTIALPDASQSNSTQLSDMRYKLANSWSQVAGFNSVVNDYSGQYKLEQNVELKLLKDNEMQSVRVTPVWDDDSNRKYVFTVTAADGSGSKQDYSYTMVRPRSSDADLEAIYVNDIAISNFRLGRYDYDYELPLADKTGPKTTEPELRSISYLAMNGQEAQVTLNGVDETSYIDVTAEDGIITRQYKINITAEKSHYSYLSNIMVNGVAVDNFYPAVLTYNVSDVAVGEPQILVGFGDKYQTVSAPQKVSDDQYTIEVTAEDGSISVYTINLLRRELEHSPMLQSIMLDGMSFADFADFGAGEVIPSQFSMYNTYYTVNLTGRVKPVVTVLTEGRATVIDQSAEEDTVKISVMAEDGVETLTYKVVINTYKESETALQDILIGGKSIADFGKSFASDIYYYQVILPESYRDYEQVEAVYDAGMNQQVTVSTSSNGQSTTISLLAEDGIHRSEYMVVQQLTPSSADTLEMIYENQVELVGFSAHTYVYNRTLAVGEHGLFPQLDAVLALGDEGKATVTRNVLKETQYEASYQFVVQAENGSTNTYTINYTVQKSAVDTLKMIYADGVEWSGFNAAQTSYERDLPVGSQFPQITYSAGDDYQTITDKVSVSADGKQSVTEIAVTAENGVQRLYRVAFTIALSSADTLVSIYDESTSEEIAGFNSHVFDYSYTLPAGTRVYPSLGYDIDYAAQNLTTVTSEWVYKDTYSARYQITVRAENGQKNIYAINYMVERSAADTLQTIEEDGVEIAGFSAHEFVYNRRLAQGTTSFPHLEARLEASVEQLQMAVVEADTVYEERYRASYRFKVTAENGNMNVYTVNYEIEQSANAQLQMILVDNNDLDGFAADKYDYEISMPMGQDVFYEVDYLQSDAVQTVESQTTVSQDGKQSRTLIMVTAENGMRQTYSVTLNKVVSAADTLKMIYADNVELSGFVPSLFNYEIELPIGTRSFPQLSYDVSDQWQVVDSVETLSADGFAKRYEFMVTAANGQRNTYRIDYSILLSDCDTLVYIALDNKPLDGFEPTKMQYYVELPYGTSVLPLISYQEGNQQQTVNVREGGVNGLTYIDVTAENGSKRTYILSFSVALSANCGLQSIMVDGVEVEDFDSDETDYRVDIVSPFKSLPQVLYEKQEMGQNVTMEVTGLVVSITVTAENGVDSRIYTVTFREIKSENAQLLAVYFDGERFYEFDKDVYEYHFDVDYTVEKRPEITWLAAEAEQTIYLEETSLLSATVHVVAANGDEEEYAFYFDRAKCPINTLDSLNIRGKLIDGFSPEVIEYTIEYAVGTTIDDLALTTDVSYVATEKHEAVYVSNDSTTLIVRVVAENGDVRVYNIYQKILLSSNAQLRDIRIFGYSLRGFEPDVYEYEYELLSDQTIPSVEEIEAIPEVEEAKVELNMAALGDTTRIFVTAPDGTQVVYSLLFKYTELAEGQQATKKDALIKHVRGTNKFIAYSIRRNVEVALYDQGGNQVLRCEVPMCNPNLADIALDEENAELFYNVSEGAEGVTLTLDRNEEIYYYVFYENKSNVIRSGRIMLVQ